MSQDKTVALGIAQMAVSPIPVVGGSVASFIGMIFGLSSGPNPEAIWDAIKANVQKMIDKALHEEFANYLRDSFIGKEKMLKDLQGVTGKGLLNEVISAENNMQSDIGSFMRQDRPYQSLPAFGVYASAHLYLLNLKTKLARDYDPINANTYQVQYDQARVQYTNHVKGLRPEALKWRMNKITSKIGHNVGRAPGYVVATIQDEALNDTKEKRIYSVWTQLDENKKNAQDWINDYIDRVRQEAEAFLEKTVDNYALIWASNWVKLGSITSEAGPQPGQKHRSSNNFDFRLKHGSEGRLRFIVRVAGGNEYKIRFDVKKDVRWGIDPVKLHDIGTDSITDVMSSAKDLNKWYISDPQNTNGHTFEVEVQQMV